MWIARALSSSRKWKHSLVKEDNIWNLESSITMTARHGQSWPSANWQRSRSSTTSGINQRGGINYLSTTIIIINSTYINSISSSHPWPRRPPLRSLPRLPPIPCPPWWRPCPPAREPPLCTGDLETYESPLWNGGIHTPEMEKNPQNPCFIDWGYTKPKWLFQGG